MGPASNVERNATNVALRVLPPLSLCGVSGIFLTLMLGFEEPHGLLLGLFSLLVLAAPAAVLLHLAFTRTLTRPEKAVWFRRLLSRRAPAAFSMYLSAEDRAADVPDAQGELVQPQAGKRGRGGVS